MRHRWSLGELEVGTKLHRGAQGLLHDHREDMLHLYLHLVTPPSQYLVHAPKVQPHSKGCRVVLMQGRPNTDLDIRDIFLLCALVLNTTVHKELHCWWDFQGEDSQLAEGELECCWLVLHQGLLALPISCTDCPFQYLRGTLLDSNGHCGVPQADKRGHKVVLHSESCCGGGKRQAEGYQLLWSLPCAPPSPIPPTAGRQAPPLDRRCRGSPDKLRH